MGGGSCRNRVSGQCVDDRPGVPLVPGSDGAVDLEATGEQQRTSTWVAIGIGVTCAVLLLVYGLVRLAMRSTARRRSGAVTTDGTS